MLQIKASRSIGMLLLGTSVALSGCASLTSDTSKTKKKDKSWFSFSKKEYPVPQAMNVTWAYDVLTLPGKPSTRGFGGRIYFYNEKTQAIPVDGELMVYGFDDSNGASDTTDLSQAAKRYKFTAEQLTTHFSESQLGASYSIWIPWDAAPGEQKKIMLIPTFIAKDGRLIRGAPASMNLPGSPRATETTILQVSGQNARVSPGGAISTAVATSPSTGNGVTTINMPRRSAQRTLETPELVAAFERLQALQQAEQDAAPNQTANPAYGFTPGFVPQGYYNAAPGFNAGITPGAYPGAYPGAMPTAPAAQPVNGQTTSSGMIPSSIQPQNNQYGPGAPPSGWALPSYATWTGLSPHFGQNASSQNAPAGSMNAQGQVVPMNR